MHQNINDTVNSLLPDDAFKQIGKPVSPNKELIINKDSAFRTLGLQLEYNIERIQIFFLQCKNKRSHIISAVWICLQLHIVHRLCNIQPADPCFHFNRISNNQLIWVAGQTFQVFPDFIPFLEIIQMQDDQNSAGNVFLNQRGISSERLLSFELMYRFSDTVHRIVLRFVSIIPGPVQTGTGPYTGRQTFEP